MEISFSYPPSNPFNKGEQFTPPHLSRPPSQNQNNNPSSSSLIELPKQNIEKVARSSLAYVKMIKNAGSSRAVILKQREAVAYANKEQQLFEQFHDFKSVDTIKHKALESSEEAKIKKEFDNIVSSNKSREEELKQLSEQYFHLESINKIDQGSSRCATSFEDDFAGNSESSCLQRETQQLVYLNSLLKMKQSQNSSVLTLKQSEDPISLHEAIQTLINNQKRVADMTEVQYDNQNQLLKKIDEIKTSLDKIQKEKNELMQVNQIFDKKFASLELREINAHKKNEEAELNTAQFERELDEIKQRGLINLQEKQQEKGDIYTEVKHLKHTMTMTLISIDQNKAIRSKQQQEIERQEQRERELIGQLGESKYLIHYICTLQNLQKMFLSGSNTDEEIEKYLQSSNSAVNFSGDHTKEANPRESYSLQNSSCNSAIMRSSEPEGQEAVNYAHKLSIYVLFSKELKEENRATVLEKLNEFWELNEKGPSEIADKLIENLESLRMSSQSLHTMYLELIQQKKQKIEQVRNMDEEILKRKKEEEIIDNLEQMEDQSEGIQPKETHVKAKEWIKNNQLRSLQRKTDFMNKIIFEVGTDNNFAEEENREEEEQDEDYYGEGSQNNEEEKNLKIKSMRNSESLGEGQYYNSQKSGEQNEQRESDANLFSQDEVLETKQKVKENEEDSLKLKQQNEDKSEQQSDQQDVNSPFIAKDNLEWEKQNNSQDEEMAKIMKQKKEMKLDTPNQMEAYIQEINKMERDKIQQKITKHERFSFKIFLNQVETLFRLSQMAQDISRKARMSISDKAFEKFGDDLKKFVSELRKGVSLKRKISKNKIQFTPFNQPIRRDDHKKFSYMEPLAARFEKDKNKPSSLNGQNLSDDPPLSPTIDQNSGNQYFQTSVNIEDQKKNKIEKFLELYQYSPLNYQEIKDIFLKMFPDSQDICRKFVDSIKNDLFLNFFESTESIEEYLTKIDEDYSESKHEASLETIRKLYLLKQNSLHLHWRNIKELFDQYLKFISTMKLKIDYFWKSSSGSLRRVLKNKIIVKGVESHSHKQYCEQVAEKIESYNCESQSLSEPITEYKAVNIKDLEESAKEKANTEDLKKIIFKLASSENKKDLYKNLIKKSQKPVEDETINLLDTVARKQLLFQDLNEEEYVDFESKQVKRESQGRKEEHFASAVIGKNGDQREMQNQKQNLKLSYLKSFVESDKVIWKLRQLENKKESGIHLFPEDYLPKHKKTLFKKDRILGETPNKITSSNNIKDSYNDFQYQKESNENSKQIMSSNNNTTAVSSQKNSIGNIADSKLSLLACSTYLGRNNRTLSPLGKKMIRESFSSQASLSKSSNVITTRESFKENSMGSVEKLKYTLPHQAHKKIMNQSQDCLSHFVKESYNDSPQKSKRRNLQSINKSDVSLRNIDMTTSSQKEGNSHYQNTSKGGGAGGDYHINDFSFPARKGWNQNDIISKLEKLYKVKS